MTETPTTAADPTAGANLGDQMVIAALTRRVVAAWAHQDADAFASVFTDDGTMILPGAFRQGRAAIREYMAEAFADQYAGTQVAGEPVGVRFLSPEVSILITQGGVVPAGASHVPAEQSIRASWLVVKRNGDWRLAAYQNSSATRSLPRPVSVATAA